MLSRGNYIKYSLEINLFFLRLAKEHAIFAAAALPPKYSNVVNELIALKKNLEMILSTAVTLSQGVITPEVLTSMEIVTDLTLSAETKTQFLTGIPIDINITKMELALRPEGSELQNPMLFEQVSMLNNQAIMGLNAALKVNEKLLADVLSCNILSHLYPQVINHIIAETRFFTGLLIKLQNREDIASVKAALIEGLKLNWNEIMKEHSQFIRGHLDPTEIKLFETANSFTKEFDKLKTGAPLFPVQPNLSLESMKRTLITTTNLRNFKRHATEGILTCSIRSISLPLFTDHITREANHYLRLLKSLISKT